jgi:hypothetical protein
VHVAWQDHHGPPAGLALRLELAAGEHRGDNARRAAVDQEPRATRAEGRRRELLRPGDRALGCKEVVELGELGQVVAQPAPAQQPPQPPRRTRAHLVAWEEEGCAHGIRCRLQRIDERRLGLVQWLQV